VRKKPLFCPGALIIWGGLLALLLVLAGCPRSSEEASPARGGKEKLPTLKETAWFFSRVNVREQLRPLGVDDSGKAVAVASQRVGPKEYPELVVYRPEGDEKHIRLKRGYATQTMAYLPRYDYLYFIINPSLFEGEGKEEVEFDPNRPMKQWWLARAKPELIGEQLPERVYTFDDPQFDRLIPFTTEIFASRFSHMVGMVLYDPGKSQEPQDDKFYLFVYWFDQEGHHTRLIPFPGETYPLLPVKLELSGKSAYILARDRKKPVFPPPPVKKQEGPLKPGETKTAAKPKRPKPRYIILRFDIPTGKSAEIWEGDRSLMVMAASGDGRRLMWGTAKRVAKQFTEYNYYLYTQDTGEVEPVEGERGLWGSAAAAPSIRGYAGVSEDLKEWLFHDQYGTLVRWRPALNPKGYEISPFFEPLETKFSPNLRWRLAQFEDGLMLIDLDKWQGFQKSHQKEIDFALRRIYEMFDGLGIDPQVYKERYWLAPVYEPFTYPRPTVEVRVWVLKKRSQRKNPYDIIVEPPSWIRVDPSSGRIIEVIPMGDRLVFLPGQKPRVEEQFSLTKELSEEEKEKERLRLIKYAHEFARLLGFDNLNDWQDPVIKVGVRSELGYPRAFSLMFPLEYEIEGPEGEKLRVNYGAASMNIGIQDVRLFGFFYEGKPKITDQPIKLTREEAWQKARDFLMRYQQEELKAYEEAGQEASAVEIGEEVPENATLMVYYPQLDPETMELFAPDFSHPRIVWAFAREDFGSVYIDAETGEPR